MLLFFHYLGLQAQVLKIKSRTTLKTVKSNKYVTVKVDSQPLCYSLNVLPQNSHVRNLTPKITVSGIWNQGLWEAIRIR